LEEAETRVARVDADVERANVEMRAYDALDGETALAGRTRAAPRSRTCSRP